MGCSSTHARFAVAALLIAAVACESTADPEDAATLRAVNASPHTATIDVLLNGQSAISGLTYLSSRSRLVPAGSWSLGVQGTGVTTGFASLSVLFTAGSAYTLLAAGPLNALDLLFAADTGSVPAPGMVKLRVIHAAPSAPGVGVDVYLTEPDADLATATRLVFPFTYGTGSSGAFPGYVQRDPGSYQVRFTEEGTTTVLVDTGSLTLTAGLVRTVVLLDEVGGGLGFIIVAEES